MTSLLHALLVRYDKTLATPPASTSRARDQNLALVRNSDAHAQSIPARQDPRGHAHEAIGLSFVTEENVAHVAYGFDSMSLPKKRLVRWVDEAFDQGALK